ncbi:hypothetical protein ACP3WJ_24215, partial [Salmonella enterica]|uniref:hypothetical protein n=1 Tax=Salmonella enterica TaxID=28901 RepID=UPI003CE877A2
DDLQVQCFQFLSQFIGSLALGAQLFAHGGLSEEEGSPQDSICCSAENLSKINLSGIASARQVNFAKSFTLLQHGAQT